MFGYVDKSPNNIVFVRKDKEIWYWQFIKQPNIYTDDTYQRRNPWQSSYQFCLLLELLVKRKNLIFILFNGFQSFIIVFKSNVTSNQGLFSSCNNIKTFDFSFLYSVFYFSTSETQRKNKSFSSPLFCQKRWQTQVQIFGSR